MRKEPGGTHAIPSGDPSRRARRAAWSAGPAATTAVGWSAGLILRLLVLGCGSLPAGRPAQVSPGGRDRVGRSAGAPTPPRARRAGSRRRWAASHRHPPGVLALLGEQLRRGRGQEVAHHLLPLGTGAGGHAA